MKLILTARHDRLIERLIQDQNYIIDRAGNIYNRKGKKLGFTKKNEAMRRGKAYAYIKYKGKELKMHRIIYRMFNGKLDRKLVVHHVDGNSLNNNADNLELVTPEINNIEAIGA